MDKYSLEKIKYKECNQEHKKSILNILFTCFGNNLDPCLYDETYLILLSYKNSLIGIICGIDNFELLKYNSHKAYHIENNKKGLFIYNLGITPLFRRKGFSNILLKLMMKHYQNKVDYFHAQVYEKNIASLRLFDKNSFEKKRTLKTDDGDNFFLLSK